MTSQLLLKNMIEMAEEIINQKKQDKEEIEERNHQIRAESVDRPELAKLTGETIRLSSKVKYQEKIIENLDKTHSQNLIGLHAEIDRLSNLVSELMFALATEGGVEGIKKISRSDSVTRFLSDPSNLPSNPVSDMYKLLETIQPFALQINDIPTQSIIKNQVSDSISQTDPIQIRDHATDPIQIRDHATDPIQIRDHATDSIQIRDHATDPVPIQKINHETQTVLTSSLHDTNVSSSSRNSSSIISTTLLVPSGTGVSQSQSPRDVNGGGEKRGLEDRRGLIDSSPFLEEKWIGEGEIRSGVSKGLGKLNDRCESGGVKVGVVGQEMGLEKKESDEMGLEKKSVVMGQIPTTTANLDDESIYLLVQKEKKKFNSLVERVSEEKKRRQSEIDSLKSEMNILKSVLKLAGLSYDVKDFKDILQAHQEVERVRTPIAMVTSKELMGNTKKALPPINSNVESNTMDPFNNEFDNDIHSTIQELQQTQASTDDRQQQVQVGKEKNKTTTSISINQNGNLLDLVLDNTGTMLVRPVPLPPPSHMPHPPIIQARKPRVKSNQIQLLPVVAVDPAFLSVSGQFTTDEPTSQSIIPPPKQSTVIPSIMQHNQNLDYQGRAHVYLDNVVLECTNDNELVHLPVPHQHQGSVSVVPMLPISERSPLLSRVFAKTIQSVKKPFDTLSEVGHGGGSGLDGGDKVGMGGMGSDQQQGDESGKKTVYSGRIWRSKLVRDKVLKRLENQF